MVNTSKPKVRHEVTDLPARFCKFQGTWWFLFVSDLLDVENNDWMRRVIAHYKNPELLERYHEEVMYWFCQKVHECFHSIMLYDATMLNYYLQNIEDARSAKQAFKEFIDTKKPTGALVYAKLNYMEYQEKMGKYEEEKLLQEAQEKFIAHKNWVKKYMEKKDIKYKLDTCRTKKPYS